MQLAIMESKIDTYTDKNRRSTNTMDSKDERILATAQIH